MRRPPALDGTSPLGAFEGSSSRGRGGRTPGSPSTAGQALPTEAPRDYGRERQQPPGSARALRVRPDDTSHPQTRGT